MTDEIPDGKDWPAKIERAGRVVLHPLAEVGVRVLMSVGIRRRQFMMHVLGDRERGDGKLQQNQSDSQAASQPIYKV